MRGESVYVMKVCVRGESVYVMKVCVCVESVCRMCSRRGPLQIMRVKWTLLSIRIKTQERVM